MNLHPKHLFYFILLTFLGASFFFGCSSSTSSSSSSSTTIDSIIVSPYAAYVSLEATQQFLAYGYAGTSNQGTVDATWAVKLTGATGETVVGTIDATGLFTATAEGSGTVEATYSGLTATAAVTVTTTTDTTSDLATIEVSPSAVTVRLGTTQEFTATGTDASGEAVDISPTWTVEATSLGTFDANGIFYPSAEGTGTVYCSSGEVYDTAVITVEGYWLEITAEADTYVDSGNATTNYGTQTAMTASYSDSSAVSYYAYVKFPLSLLPTGASVESASIKLYVTSTDQSEFEIYLVSGAWNETSMTWNNKAAQGDYLTSGTFASGQYNNISGGDVPTIVQEWFDGTTSNNGILIRKGTGAEGSVSFLTKDNTDNKPMLELEYTVP